MKNIFAVRYQKDGKLTQPDGAHFIINHIDESQNDLIGEFDGKIKKINDQIKLPIWLLIIYYVMIFVSIAFILGIIGALQEVDLATAFARGPYLFIGLPVALFAWGGIALYKRARTRKITQGDDVKNLQKEAEQIILDSRHQLGIPDEALKVDTLHYFYEEKDGKTRVKQGLGAQYFNLEMNAYVDGKNFYLGDLTRVFAFPLDSLVGLRVVNKTISIDNWNKKEPFNGPLYAEHKIKTNSNGILFIRTHYVLSIKIGEQDYEIFFPGYEGKSLAQLISLPIETKE